MTTPGRTVCAVVAALSFVAARSAEGVEPLVSGSAAAAAQDPAGTLIFPQVEFSPSAKSAPTNGSVGAIIIAAAQSISDAPTRSVATPPAKEPADSSKTVADASSTQAAPQRQPEVRQVSKAADQQRESSPFVAGGIVECPYGSFHDTRNLYPMPPTRKRTESPASNSILGLFGQRNSVGPKRSYGRTGR